MEVSGELQAPAAFLPRKEPPYPSDRRLDGPQSRSGCSGEERKSHHYPWRYPSFCAYW